MSSPGITRCIVTLYSVLVGTQDKPVQVNRREKAGVKLGCDGAGLTRVVARRAGLTSAGSRSDTVVPLTCHEYILECRPAQDTRRVQADYRTQLENGVSTGPPSSS